MGEHVKILFVGSKPHEDWILKIQAQLKTLILWSKPCEKCNTFCHCHGKWPKAEASTEVYHLFVLPKKYFLRAENLRRLQLFRAIQQKFVKKKSWKSIDLIFKNCKKIIIILRCSFWMHILFKSIFKFLFSAVHLVRDF